jgi:hypothetical protein
MADRVKLVRVGSQEKDGDDEEKWLLESPLSR